MSKLSPRQAFISDVVFALIGSGLGYFVGGKLWEMKKGEGERKAVVCSHCGARC